MKVKKVWNIEPQKMLDYILQADRSEWSCTKKEIILLRFMLEKI